MTVPSWIYEEEAGAPTLVVAGVDEVGRGPLAGPVVAAAVVLPYGVDIPELRDSKVLSQRQREICAARVRGVARAVGLGWVGPEVIDRVNIQQATFLAMRAAIAQLGKVDFLLVDGRQVIPELTLPQRAIVDGDSLVMSIAAASVVAKVERDRYMREQARLYPHYGWERNMGYGTREHLTALRRDGPTPLHRFSFAPVREAAGAEGATAGRWRQNAANQN